MQADDIINKLKDMKGEECVSIAIPTVEAGDYEKNRIRWKNAIKELKQKFEDMNKPFDKIESNLESLSNDSNFWAKQKTGLVGYFSETVNEILKLNHEVVTISDVSDTFNLYPAVSEMQAHSSLYIFCISKNKTALYLMQGGSLNKIDISENVVDNYDEAMNFDDPDKSLQHHTVSGGDAIFHANSANEDIDDVRTEQFLKRADDGLMEIIQGQSVPLVLACVEEYYPMYKKVTAYKDLHPEIIAGNPDLLNEDSIKESANCLLTEILGKKVTNFLDRYNEMAKGELLFNTVDDFRSSLKMNNIDTILVNEFAFKNMEGDEVNKLTRDVVGAYNNGAKVICVTDKESNETVLGIRRFVMETVV